jgi:osmotically-inducible protein OsmY
MAHSEEHIKRSVVDRISSDAGVDCNNIGVYVHEGQVVLRGTVASSPASDSATANALQVAGVTEVDNQLEVRTPPQEAAPADEQLQSRIEAALWESPSTHRSQLQVTVTDKVATITGSVETLWMKIQGERIASEVSGVIGVRNDAQIVPPESMSDSAIARAILDALEQSRLIDDETVGVRVEGGVVTLLGSVASHSASLIAHNFALNTVGVMDLQNKLVVRNR